jgi:predicted transcriptional regulator of viral defense system
MIRKLKPINVQQLLSEKGMRLFSPSDFQRIFGVSLPATQGFIKNHSRDLFLKVRNGLYALRSDPPQEEIIANRLYAPSYISFEYVLSRYGIIPESAYAVTSATTRLTREFIVNGKSFAYSHIKKEAYRGYKAEKAGGGAILIAEPEKAFADYLYFVDLKKKALNERIDTRRLKKKTALGYIKLFSKKTLIKLAERIL